MKIVIPITNGKISCNECIDKINAHFKKCKDGKYIIEIKKYFKDRSSAQNATLWMVYNEISEQTGYTSEEIHQDCTKAFLSYVKNERTYVKSTAKLNSLEFKIYLDKIVHYFTVEAGLIIHLPEDYNG